MKPTTHAQIFGLVGGMLLVAMAAGGPAPSAAQNLPVVTAIKPTAARWLDQWFGMRTGGDFVLAATTDSVRVARLNQPRRFRVCITGATPADQNVGAKVVTEDTEIVIPVGHCGELDARHVTVVPATGLGRSQEVHGFHEIIS